MFGFAKSHRTGVYLAAVGLMGWGLAGCSDSGHANRTSQRGAPAADTAQFVAGEVDTLPYLRYADGLLSVNDRCPVRKLPLNPRMPPVYVNGRPVGFC